MRPPIRIVIAEPDHAYHEWLCIRLRHEPDLEVVEEAREAREAIVAAGRIRADVLVLDLDLPGMDGLDALEVVTWWSPTTLVLILLGKAHEALGVQALIRGARGYLIKDERFELADAIRAVQRGEIWARRQVVARAIEELIYRISP